MILELTVVLGFTNTKNVDAEEPIRVFINGYQVIFTQLPVVEDGNTLVQFRPLFEMLNYKIAWDDETESINASTDTINLKLSIGSD